jgi:general secretion pathway protein A
VPLAQRLADPGLTREAAFARLWARWKLDPPAAAEDSCAYAARMKLRCLPVREPWFRLLSLGLPAVLDLALPSGERRYAVLLGSGNGKVGLDLGEGARTYPLAALLPYWKGGAVLLWKPPDGMAGTLVPGQRSEAVRWIRERLRAPGATDEEDRFDPGLKARLLAFQTERGLSPDGMAGPHTLIFLGLLADDPAVPRLETLPP